MATPTDVVKDVVKEVKVDISKVVTFISDTFPFVRGDVINLANFTKEEIAKVMTSHYVKGIVAVADLPAIEAPEEE
jgi:hypothetical protein